MAYNLGGTANLYDTVDTSSLATLTAAGMTADTSVRLSPADAAPPTTAPGVTLSGSKTFTYNVVVGRLTTCGTDKTVSVSRCCAAQRTQGARVRSAPGSCHTRDAA